MSIFYFDRLRTPAIAGGNEVQRNGRLPERRWLSPPWVAGLVLAVGDMVIIDTIIRLATLLRERLAEWHPIGLDQSVVLELHVLVVLLPVGFLTVGLYPGYGNSGIERLRMRVSTVIRVFGAILLFDYVAQDGRWSRGITLMSGVFTLIALPIWDAVARGVLIRLGIWGTPAAVWGEDVERRRTVIRILNQHPELGWFPMVEGPLPTPETPAVPKVAVAVVVLPPSGPVTAPDDLPYRRVVLVQDIDGAQSLWVTPRDLGAHLGLETQRNLLLPFNRYLKRFLDLILATALLTVIAPLIAVCGVLIKIVSPGPAFYAQTRRGRDGRPFRMYKLRTMVPDAERRLEELLENAPDAREEWRRYMKLRRDPRIIPAVGGLMRRFSIDELPQLWNVICGEMSLVGPRPLPEYHLALLEPGVLRLRQRVRPGVTGLWQISGRSLCTIQELQHLDAYYVRNWSFWLDLYILAGTTVEVARGKGAQ